MTPFTPELLQQALDLVNSAGGAAYEAAYRATLVHGWILALSAAFGWASALRLAWSARSTWRQHEAGEIEGDGLPIACAFLALVAAFLAYYATLGAGEHLLATEWVAIRALLEVVR